jgi:tetratricopeptide (TPR) repeat protein
VILLAVLLAYLPALGAGFVWDDDWYVTKNPHLLTAGGLGRIWFEIGATVQYYPLVFTSFWIEHHLWGLSAAGYHLTNVCLHALNALLLWIVLRRLAVPGAWLAAALFAVHPIHVESVAWITERKNVLSGFFYLLSLLAYLKYVDLDGRGPARTSSWRLYLLALALFMLALLSKTVTCTLPVTMLLILWWKRRRLAWGDAIPLLPMFVIGLVMGSVTAWMEKHNVGAVGEAWNLSGLDRLLIATRAVWFYLGKLAWPSEIIFFYPRWRIDATDWQGYLWPVLILAALVLLWTVRRLIGAGPLAAALFFGVTLAPALAFVDVYPMRFSFVANHFAYLASIGPIALAAALVTVAFSAGGRRAEIAAMSPVGRLATTHAPAALTTVVLVVFALLASREARAYADAETLWRDTIAKNPDAWLAHNNLANDLAVAGHQEEAAKHFREAIRAKPDYADGHYNLGNTLLVLGRLDEAGREFGRAIELKSTHVAAHNGLGIVLDRQGRSAEAETAFRQAIGLKPSYTESRLNLALLLAKQGKDADAVDHLRQALKQRPEMADARIDLGLALVRLNRQTEAIPELEEALRLEPASAEARNAMGNALLALGKEEAAKAQYEEAIRLQPDHADAQSNLGLLLARRGDLNGAIEHLSRAVEIRPAFPEAHNGLGGVLAYSGRLDEAIEHVKKAVELAPSYADAQRNLGLALTMTGRLQEAVSAYRRAVDLRPGDIGSRLALAELLDRQGDRAAAAAEYERVLQIAPQNATALKAIAEFASSQPIEAAQ